MRGEVLELWGESRDQELGWATLSENKYSEFKETCQVGS